MIVLPEIENENLNHILWITNVGAMHESKVGLTHLTEHTCLLPSFLKNRDIGNDSIKIYGATCPHYMFFYIAVSLEYDIWTNEWIRSVISNEVITNKNVSIAKRQVISECKALQELTEVHRQVIDFVSNGRMQELPIGTIESVNEILTQEVKTHLAHICENNLFRFFSFRTAEEFWKQYKKNPVYMNNNILSLKKDWIFDRDQVLTVINRSITKCRIEYFFLLPETQSSEEYLTLIFLESLLAHLIESTIPFSCKVSEKFFSKDLGFLSIQFFPQSDSCFKENHVLELIDYLRKNIFTRISDVNFFSEIKKHIAEDVSQIYSRNEFYSTSECWAQIMSNIVYGRPIYDFEQRKDIYIFLQTIETSIIEVLYRYILSPAKVIVYLPCS